MLWIDGLTASTIYNTIFLIMNFRLHQITLCATKQTRFAFLPYGNSGVDMRA